FKERLQTSLACLRLVGSISGIELASSGDCVDNSGDEVIVTSAAEEADGVVCRAVQCCQLGHVLRQLHFAHRWRDIERPLQPTVHRYLGKQFFYRLDADLLQHRFLIGIRVQDVRHSAPPNAKTQNAEFRMQNSDRKENAAAPEFCIL